MTPNGFIAFSTCLRSFPAAKDSPWSSVAKWYEVQLRQIPDEDAPFMMFAIGQKFGGVSNPFRPQPAAILDLWREIKNPRKMTSVEAVERIQEAVKTGRVGINMTRKTVFLKTPTSATVDEIKSALIGNLKTEGEKSRIGKPESVMGLLGLPKLNLDLGTPVEIKVPTPIKLSGQPDSITNDPTLCKIVQVMGGWESLSTNKSEYLRGQLMKVADAVIREADDEVLHALRYEYREMAALAGERMKELE